MSISLIEIRTSSPPYTPKHTQTQAQRTFINLPTAVANLYTTHTIFTHTSLHFGCTPAMLRCTERKSNHTRQNSQQRKSQIYINIYILSYLFALHTSREHRDYLWICRWRDQIVVEEKPIARRFITHTYIDPICVPLERTDTYSKPEFITSSTSSPSPESSQQELHTKKHTHAHSIRRSHTHFSYFYRDRRRTHKWMVTHLNRNIYICCCCI